MGLAQASVRAVFQRAQSVLAKALQPLVARLAADPKKNLQNLLDTTWPSLYIVSDQEGVMQRISNSKFGVS